MVIAHQFSRCLEAGTTEVAAYMFNAIEYGPNSTTTKSKPYYSVFNSIQIQAYALQDQWVVEMGTFEREASPENGDAVMPTHRY